jgi:hypothetical protein
MIGLEGDLGQYNYSRVDLIERLYHRKKAKISIFEHYGIKDINIDDVEAICYNNTYGDIIFIYKGGITNKTEGCQVSVFAIPEVNDNNFPGICAELSELTDHKKPNILLVIENFKCLAISKKRLIEIFKQHHVDIKFINELI